MGQILSDGNESKMKAGATALTATATPEQSFAPDPEQAQCQQGKTEEADHPQAGGEAESEGGEADRRQRIDQQRASRPRTRRDSPRQTHHLPLA